MRVFAAILFVACLLWATTTAALFAMWVSVGFGVTAVVAFLATHGRRRGLVAAAIVVAAPVVLIEFSLHEFADEVGAITTRVEGADPAATGPVLGKRRHLAIRWLNLHMAAGGWLLGFREVATETLLLDRSSTPERRAKVQAEPIRKRRRYCRAGAGRFGPAHRRASDFPMDAPVVRHAAATLAENTRDGQRRWHTLDWPGGYANARHPLHVLLALLVPDARLHARRDGDVLHMSWQGSIQYPAGHRITIIHLPRPVGPASDLVLDEAMFCGLQMDGVFVPYRMTWSWQTTRDAAREDTDHPTRRLADRLLR